MSKSTVTSGRKRTEEILHGAFWTIKRADAEKPELTFSDSDGVDEGENECLVSEETQRLIQSATEKRDLFWRGRINDATEAQTKMTEVRGR